jgi:hypothetical protein
MIETLGLHRGEIPFQLVHASIDLGVNPRDHERTRNHHENKPEHPPA